MTNDYAYTTRRGSFQKHHARRLRALISKLESLPSRRFRFSDWATGSLPADPMVSKCGTVACAGGWATTVPSLRRAGLRLIKRYGCNSVALFIKDPDGVERIDAEDHEALSVVLGLSAEEAGVFMPHGWSGRGMPNRDRMVARLRKLLRAKIAEAEFHQCKTLNW